MRPEDVWLHGDPSATDSPVIGADIYAVEPLGDRTIFDLRVGAEIVKVRTAPTFEAPQSGRIWFSMDMNRVHLFDPRTELRIEN